MNGSGTALTSETPVRQSAPSRSFVRSSRALGPLLLAASMVASVSCGGAEIPIVGRGPAAGSYGYLLVSRDEAHRIFRVAVEMRELPPPRRINSDATAYVAWAAAPGRTPGRLSTVEYDPYLRRAFAAGTTTHSRFEVTITAESNADITTPRGRVVARRNYPPPSY